MVGLDQNKLKSVVIIIIIPNDILLCSRLTIILHCDRRVFILKTERIRNTDLKVSFETVILFLDIYFVYRILRSGFR